KLLLEKLPFFALALAASVVTFFVQKHGGSIMSADAMPLPLRLENVLVSYATYLRQFFWPGGMELFYPYPRSLPPWETVGAGLLLAALSLAVVGLARKQPYLAVGWFWYLGTLVPVIGLVQVGIQQHADRYTYIPYIGLSLMVVWGAHALLAARPHGKPALAWAGGLALAGCLIATRTQAGYWRSSTALFEHAIKVTPGNYAAHN